MLTCSLALGHKSTDAMRLVAAHSGRKSAAKTSSMRSSAGVTATRGGAVGGLCCSSDDGKNDEYFSGREMCHNSIITHAHPPHTGKMLLCGLMSNVSNLSEKKQGFEKPFITGFSNALRLFLEFNFIKSISASSASPPLVQVP